MSKFTEKCATCFDPRRISLALVSNGALVSGPTGSAGDAVQFWAVPRAKSLTFSGLVETTTKPTKSHQNPKGKFHSWLAPVPLRTLGLPKKTD